MPLPGDVVVITKNHDPIVRLLRLFATILLEVYLLLGHNALVLSHNQMYAAIPAEEFPEPMVVYELFWMTDYRVFHSEVDILIADSNSMHCKV